MFLRSLFLSLLFFQVCISQEVVNIPSILASEEIHYAQKVKTIDSILKLPKKISGETNNTTQLYIDWLFSQKKYHKIIDIASKYINSKKNAGTNPNYIQYLYYQLGRSNFHLKKYDNSISYLESATQVVDNNNMAGMAHFYLAKCYYKKQDYYKSIKHYKINQSLHIKHDSLSQLFKSYVNITLPYNKLKTKKNYLKSRSYFLKADSLIKNKSIGKEYDYVIKIGLGNSYNTHETLDLNKASYYYNEALKILEKNKDSFNIGICYSRLGNLYNTTYPDLAIKYHLKRLNYLNRNDSLKYNITYDNIAYSYNRKMLYDQSIQNYKKSIKFLIGNPDENWYKHIKNHIKKDLSNKNYLLVSLRNLADTYLKKYKLKRNKQSIDNAIKTYLLTDQLLDIILIESQEFQSKLFWREQSAKLYGKAIEACFLSNDFDNGFYFMEKNKALLLNQHIIKQQIKQSLNLPNSLVNTEIQLKKDIYNLKHLTDNTENKESISIKLLEKESILKKLQDSIENTYSNYKAITSNTKIAELKEIQDNLDKDSAIVTYNISQYDDYSLITPENGYIPVIPDCNYGVKTLFPAYGMLITKNSIDFFKLHKADQLKEKVNAFLSLLKKTDHSNTDTNIYNQLGYELYSTLIPEKLQNSIALKKIRIIPDNYLNYLPFEALITSNKEKPNYWIQENEISYAYSNSFLQSIPKYEKDSSESFAGFAPITFDNAKLPNLKYSQTEIENIKQYYKANLFTHDKATKKAFLSILPKYDIIHLATHAESQDSITPWIAFKKEKIFLDEFNLTTNKAQMVVLSACNTLLGKKATGEGILSLARGFFQSGAQSVVSSLWEVDDQPTAEIMSAFYKNLSNGDSKSKALQKAKINYIENCSFDKSTPFYWASFVVLGNTDPLNVNSNDWLNCFFVYVPIIMALLLIVFWCKKLFK